MNEKTIVVKQGSFSSLLRGMVIGAALAMLFAPRSGRETRDMITQKGNELKDRATGMAMGTRDRVQAVVDDARNKITETMKSASDSGDVSKKELKRELEIMEDVNNPDYPL